MLLARLFATGGSLFGVFGTFILLVSDRDGGARDHHEAWTKALSLLPPGTTISYQVSDEAEFNTAHILSQVNPILGITSLPAQQLGVSVQKEANGEIKIYMEVNAGGGNIIYIPVKMSDIISSLRSNELRGDPWALNLNYIDIPLSAVNFSIQDEGEPYRLVLVKSSEYVNSYELTINFKSNEIYAALLEKQGHGSFSLHGQRLFAPRDPNRPGRQTYDIEDGQLILRSGLDLEGPEFNAYLEQFNLANEMAKVLLSHLNRTNESAELDLELRFQ